MMRNRQFLSCKERREIGRVECKQMLAVWLLLVSILCAHDVERVEYLVVTRVFSVVVNSAPWVTVLTFAVAVSGGSDYRGICSRFYVVTHYSYNELFTQYFGVSVYETRRWCA